MARPRRKPSARQQRIQRKLPVFLGRGKVHSTTQEHYAFLSQIFQHVKKKDYYPAHCCIDRQPKETSLCVYVFSNTAQLLSELGHTKDSTKKAAKLEEALWLFELCLERQTTLFNLYEISEKTGNPLQIKQNVPLPPDAQPEDVEMLDGEPIQGASHPQGNAEKQVLYARMVEPTTKDTLLDTIVAQLATLTQLVEETQPSEANDKMISFMQDYWVNTISNALSQFDPYLGHPRQFSPNPKLTLGNRTDDIKLAIANYKCGMANFNYNARKIDVSEYEAVVTNAYDFNMSNNPQALCDAAESFVDFHDVAGQAGLNFEPHLSQRWKILSHALDFLSTAVKLPSCENKENIFAKRGDIELLRFQLGRDGVAYRVAVQNKDTILNNAGKHYRGAMSFAKQAGASGKYTDAEFRSFVVEAFLGNMTNLVDMSKTVIGFGQLLQEAVIDGVVMEEQVVELGLEKYLG